MHFNVIGSGSLMSRHTTSGLDDLETLYPDLAKEWHPLLNGALQPSEVLP